LAFLLGLLAFLLGLLALLLHPAELAGELRDLALLLIDLGPELIMELLELACQPRGVPLPLTASLGALTAATATAGPFVSRSEGSASAPRPARGGAASLHLRLGTELGQRQRHVDAQV